MNNSQFPTDQEPGKGLYVSRSPASCRCAAGEETPHGDMLFTSNANRTPRRPSRSSGQSPYRSASHVMPLPVMAAKPTQGGSTTEVLADGTVLEVVLPVLARMGDKEEARQTLGITMRTAASSPHSSARVLRIRATDPTDPFLLFELELREEDYAAFKQRLELRVDFLAFPKYLVSLFQAIANEASPCHVSFTVHPQDTGKGILRILEATDFKTVEHVSLILLRQGDVGQKKYLAERFQFFARSYEQCAADREAQERHYTRTIARMRQELSDLTQDNTRLQQEMKLSKSESDKAFACSLSEVRDAHAKEMQSVRDRFLGEMKELREASARAQSRLTDDVRSKDDEAQRLRDANRSLESAQASLRSQLALAEDKVAALTAEVESLRDTNSQLTHFKIESTKAMSENELNYVSVTERLRAATKGLKDKEDELQSLREHYQKQDDYIRMLSSQNEQAQERAATANANLEKSHHIIAHQLETIKNLKERYRIATDQVASKESLLQERHLAAQRVKDELASATERVQTLQQKNNDLKEQLQRTDAAHERLSQELKQSQTALLHLQRSTSVNGRHWGVFSSGATAGMSSLPTMTGLTGAAAASGGIAPSSSALSGAGLYSQFSRHATMHTPLGAAGAGTPHSTTPAVAVGTDMSSSAAVGQNLFRTTTTGTGLTAAVPQSAPAPNQTSEGGLKMRNADNVNRIGTLSSVGKDSLRAKNFFNDANGTPVENRSAYFAN